MGRVRFLCLVLLFWPLGLAAQVFVDAPPVLDNPPLASATSTVGGGSEAFGNGHFYQISSGMVNYGYNDHVFAQFTGDQSYQKGSSPTSTFGNITYLDVTETNLYQILRGWAWGLEWLHFSATPASVSAGVGLIVAPPVSMSLNLLSATGRLYFQDLSLESLQPFIGMGLGMINGEMNATLNDGSQTRTTFKGWLHYNTFGANVKLGSRSGIIMELRKVTAPSVATSNDPYNQAKGKLRLNFGGEMLNVTGYFRF